jgi:hypothetical protein
MWTDCVCGGGRSHVSINKTMAAEQGEDSLELSLSLLWGEKWRAVMCADLDMKPKVLSFPR